MDTATAPYIQLTQGGKNILLTSLPAEIVTKISYAAVRGQSQEPGAVQRILNKSRILSIKEFTINVGDFPNSIILNWVSEDNPLRRHGNSISFNVQEDCAQIIDGQHRLAGIQEAINARPSSIRGLELPVAIYERLSTRECADIFLSINTEQKTVPRSLVFDLYGVAGEALIDHAALRARDIAIFLNEEKESPYAGNIKLPGAKVRKGGIALSTAVTAIKPLVEERGDFERIGVYELELQRRIILNFFVSLSTKYGEDWDARTNAFQYAAGFTGAVDFLRLKMIPYCNQVRSFEVETIKESLSLERDNLILQEEVKGIGGKDAPRIIYERLDKAFEPKQAAVGNLKI